MVHDDVGDADVGQNAEHADGAKDEVAIDQRRPSETFGAIGQGVVHREVQGHGRQGGHHLRRHELPPCTLYEFEHAEVAKQATASDDQEQEQLRRQKSPRQLVQQEQYEFDHDHDVELACAHGPAAKDIGRFHDPQLTARRSHDIEQDLVTLLGQVIDAVQEGFAA